MLLKITGRVRELESGLGVPFLVVKAIDKDLFYDDLVGDTTTDNEGKFEIVYEEKDFKEIFEKAPDLYIVIKSPDRSRIIYSSEKNVRCEAGKEEHFEITIPRAVLGALIPKPEPGYGPLLGRLNVTLRDTIGNPIKSKVILLISEHKPIAKKQHRFEYEEKSDISEDLPSGTYTVQAYAVGYEIGRKFVKIQPGKNTNIEFELAKVTQPKPRATLGERLAIYGLSEIQIELGSLTLQKGERIELDYRKEKNRIAFTMLHAKSINDLKKWIGSPDSSFGHDQPVLGTLPLIKKLSDEVLKDSKKLSSTDRSALALIANEFIYGNSQSVAQFAVILDQFFTQNYPEGLPVPIFHGDVITIPEGAVLVVGNGSSVFFCNHLRIHRGGFLDIVDGPVTVDIGLYEQFD